MLSTIQSNTTLAIISYKVTFNLFMLQAALQIISFFFFFGHDALA